jgi:hypothetical protein
VYALLLFSINSSLSDRGIKALVVKKRKECKKQCPKSGHMGNDRNVLKLACGDLCKTDIFLKKKIHELYT